VLGGLAQFMDSTRSASAAKGDTIRKSCQRYINSVPGMQLRMVSPEQAWEPRAPEKIPPESRCRPSELVERAAQVSGPRTVLDPNRLRWLIIGVLATVIAGWCWLTR